MHVYGTVIDWINQRTIVSKERAWGRRREENIFPESGSSKFCRKKGRIQSHRCSQHENVVISTEMEQTSFVRITKRRFRCLHKIRQLSPKLSPQLLTTP